MRLAGAVLACLVAILLVISNLHGPAVAPFAPARPMGQQRPAPCVPRLFRVGTVDPQFGVSEDKLKEIALSAAEEWRQATDRTWFAHDATRAALEINLLYDGRQADYAASRQEREEIESQGARLQSLHDLIQRRLQLLQSLPPPEQAGAAAEAERLVQRARGDWKILRERIAAFNMLRLRYDSNFTGGQYERHGSRQAIDIFFFSDEEDLRRTILHELGHAMGLDHADDPSAIMHPVKTWSRGLQEEDIRAALRLAPCEG